MQAYIPTCSAQPLATKCCCGFRGWINEMSDHYKKVAGQPPASPGSMFQLLRGKALATLRIVQKPPACFAKRTPEHKKHYVIAKKV